MAYVEGTIHGQGFSRLFTPEMFERQGRAIVEKGFAILEPRLDRHDYAAGDSFTIADAALLYVERWAEPQGIPLPVNVERHYRRMLARPKVQRVRELWREA